LLESSFEYTPVKATYRAKAVAKFILEFFR